MPYSATIFAAAIDRAGDTGMRSERTWDQAEQLARDEETLRSGFWRKLGKSAAYIPFAEELLTAYYCAFDRATPVRVRAGLLGALAYFVLPFDVLPDLLPALGLTDDAAVLAAAVRLVLAHITPEHRAAAQASLKRLTHE
jgi:uncharacterized membrane protein YkvA (DUF1232 family)